MGESGSSLIKWIVLWATEPTSLHPLVLDSSADQNEESVMSESEDEKVSNGNSYFTFLFIYFYLFVELDGMIDWFMFCGMNWPQNINRTSSKLRF